MVKERGVESCVRNSTWFIFLEQEFFLYFTKQSSPFSVLCLWLFLIYFLWPRDTDHVGGKENSREKRYWSSRKNPLRMSSSFSFLLFLYFFFNNRRFSREREVAEVTRDSVLFRPRPPARENRYIVVYLSEVKRNFVTKLSARSLDASFFFCLSRRRVLLLYSREPYKK